jgi:pimeloyl-ACP methyl ester carboxylesterase
MRRREFLVMSSVTAASMAFASPTYGKQLPNIDAAWYQRSRRFAAVTTGRVAYVERGRGPATLFLHAFPLNAFQWRGAIARLAKHRHCIAPDFMALGYTETAESHEITPVTQADMLAEFLDALKIKDVDIIANDTGGEVAQLFLARHPGRTRTLLLTNCDVSTNSPPPSFKPVLAAAQKGVLADSFQRLLADKTLARSPKGLGAFYTDPSSLTDEAIEYYFSPLVSSPLRKAQLNHFAAALGENPLVVIESDLKRSRVPVRMVWGEADTTFDVTWADWLDKTFPNSRGVRRVPGAKLFFPEEMPELITEEALRLWSRA